MPLNKEQKKQLAKVRKLLSSSLWADVHQALVILTALNDPQLWALLGKGLSLASSWRSSNYIEVGIGEIKTRVKAEHRYSVALWAAREVGMLDQLTVLDLKPASRSSRSSMYGSTRAASISARWHRFQRWKSSGSAYPPMPTPLI